MGRIGIVFFFGGFPIYMVFVKYGLVGVVVRYVTEPAVQFNEDDNIDFSR